MSHRLRLTLGVLFLAACGRTAPTVTSGDAPQPIPDPRIESSHERITTLSGITLNPDSGVRHYSSSSTTALQTMPGTDSSQAVIIMTLGFSLSYSRLPSLHTRIAGALTQMSLTIEGFAQPPDQQPVLPLGFAGYIASGNFHLDSLAGSPISTVLNCQAAELNGITVIQRSFVVSPLILSAGTTWTDSSTVPACSGSIQHTLTAVRTYTVAGQAIRGAFPVIVVDRRDRVRGTGEGAQGQHRISILSEGSGSARIYLDRMTGLLRESEGTQTVNLVISSSGRSQRFRQVVGEQVRLQQ